MIIYTCVFAHISSQWTPAAAQTSQSWWPTEIKGRKMFMSLLDRFPASLNKWVGETDYNASAVCREIGMKIKVAKNHPWGFCQIKKNFIVFFCEVHYDWNLTGPWCRAQLIICPKSQLVSIPGFWPNQPIANLRNIRKKMQRTCLDPDFRMYV